MKLKRYTFTIITAILVFTPIIEAQNPQQLNPVQIYLNTADQYYNEGKLERALNEYQKVLKLDPKNQHAQSQVNLIRQKLGLPESPSKTSTGLLPPRDYSKITLELGDVYLDKENGFSIKPPKGWLIDSTDPSFSLKLTEPFSEGFIFIKAIPAPELVVIDEKFQNSVQTKLKEMEKSIKGFRVEYVNLISFKQETALQSIVNFPAGPNQVKLTTTYLAGNKIFIISWACQSKLEYVFKPIFERSIATFQRTGP